MNLNSIYLNIFNVLQSFNFLQNEVLFSIPFLMIYINFLALILFLSFKKYSFRLNLFMIFIIFILKFFFYKYLSLINGFNLLLIGDILFTIIMFFIIYKTRIGELLSRKFIFLTIFILGNIFLISQIYNLSIKNYNFNNYNFISYYIDVGIEKISNGGQPLENISNNKTIKDFKDLYQKQFTKKLELSERIKLYELYGKLSDKDKLLSRRLIVYNIDTYYGFDLFGNIELCDINNATISKIKDYKYALRVLNFKDLILIKNGEEIYFSSTKELKCQNISNKDIVLNQNDEVFLQNLGKEALFAGINDSFFENLHKIKEYGKIINTKIPNKEDKIYAIYQWITKNITYDEKTSERFSKKKEISEILKGVKNEYHSGIMTFKNRKGVCTGYSGLFYFFLYYSGVNDVEIVLGKSYNENLGRYIGHAWNKIGDNYYDTTFESSYLKSEGKVSNFFYKKSLDELYSIDKRNIDITDLSPIQISSK